MVGTTKSYIEDSESVCERIESWVDASESIAGRSTANIGQLAGTPRHLLESRADVRRMMADSPQTTDRTQPMSAHRHEKSDGTKASGFLKYSGNPIARFNVNDPIPSWLGF